jgi:hypothetical protein
VESQEGEFIRLEFEKDVDGDGIGGIAGKSG